VRQKKKSFENLVGEQSEKQEKKSDNDDDERNDVLLFCSQNLTRSNNHKLKEADPNYINQYYEYYERLHYVHAPGA
jgi:hypothetical protein